MLLAAEVGNTNTIFGLFDTVGELVVSYRLSTERERMPDEWYALLASLLATDGLTLAGVEGAIISSVVPGVTTWLVEMVRQRFGIEAIVVRGDLDIGLELDVEEPTRLGADRIVDCIAAKAIYGAPVLVVDIGTATTLDVVGGDGAYKGGAISAGVATSLKALAGDAAQLFNVELFLPERVIGRSTADQLRSGIVTGHLALLEGLILRTRAELAVDAPVVLTGGLAPLFAGRSPLFDHHEPNLTLTGLRMVFERIGSNDQAAAEAIPEGTAPGA